MRKKNYGYNLAIIIIVIIAVFVFGDFEKGIDLLKNISIVCLWVIKIYNTIFVAFTGDGILYHIFGYPITFLLVGILLCYIGIKGKFGSIIGKIIYWFVGMIVGFVLNLFNEQLFYYIIN